MARLGLAILIVSLVECRQIKIIKEPAQFGSYVGNRPVFMPNGNMKSHVLPSGIVTPPHLAILKGQCFNKVVKDYKYVLCPFENVTQHEQSLKWNPYSGILGVWKEWKMKRYEFEEMLMLDGDQCGDKRRSARVRLVCSQNETLGDAHIISVEEPATCEYLITLGTPLICFNYSLHVYPFLPYHFQHEWDLLEGRYQDGEITEKGYNYFLQELLKEAGLLLGKSEDKARRAKDEPTDVFSNRKKNHVATNNNESTFLSLEKCNEEYFELKEDIEKLNKELEDLKNSIQVATNNTRQ